MALSSENYSTHRWTPSAPKQEKWKNVILRDFDTDTQLKINFHSAVCAAFFDRLYTDEDDAELLWVFPEGNEVKKREVKYGNNIAVLFKAMYQFREFYNWKIFWSAIAIGWKANGPCIRTVANILVRARRNYRKDHGLQQSVCQTAKAADLWIEFLDSNVPAQTLVQGYDNILYPSVKEFYENMESKMVNAGRVPRDFTVRSSPPESVPDRPPVRVSVISRVKKEGQGSDQQDDRSIVDRPTRKRSRSPCPSEGPTSKRPNHTVTDGPREATSSVPSKAGDTQSLPSNEQASPPASTNDIPQTKNSSSEEEAPETPPEPIKGCDRASPESRAADVERLITAGALVNLKHANEGIKETVVALRNKMEALADSMAAIVDHVESVRHDVNELNKQQQQQQVDHSLPGQGLSNLEALVQKCATEITSLKADMVGRKIVSDTRAKQQEECQQLLKSTAASSLELMQDMTSYTQTMMNNVSALKSQLQPPPAPPPPVQLDAIKSMMEGLFAKHESKITSQVESLLAQRDDEIKTQIDNQLAKHQESTASQIEYVLVKQLAHVNSSIERITERNSELHSSMEDGLFVPQTGEDMIQFQIDRMVAERRQREQGMQPAIMAEPEQRMQPQVLEDMIQSSVDTVVAKRNNDMQSRMREDIEKIVAEREQRIQPKIEELLSLAQQGSKIQAKFEDIITQQSKIENTISQQAAKLDKILTRPNVEESISETQSNIATHFREQNTRLEKLGDEMSRIRSDVERLAEKFLAPKRTMREAITAAVIDMKEHQETVQRFYNHMSRHGNRSMSELTQIADFLVKLDDTLISARVCINPPVPR
ncbi:hypothetical protein QBC37DRAFT_47425 [Rhypophila decipiens]|uniref:Uncharacterized protein n=1 Tax=Rhypophila decipiens TaxID=261697 RepID=A0AAN7BB71_9PEZI|nr:hypothetical protein QBC37DRAFT_47425 [Rhypophila decipiens]